jgi:hypothetical protein
MLNEYRRAGLEIEFTGGSSPAFWHEIIGAHCNEIGMKWKGNSHCKWEGAKIDINITKDGSVTPPGMELQTRPFYVQDEDFVDKFKSLMRCIVVNGAVIDKTCGLHLHLSAKEYINKTIANLFVMYNNIQDELLAMVDPSRKSSSFAKPLSVTDRMLMSLMSLKSSQLPAIGGHCTDRYMLLNVSLIPSQRHYEIRLCHGMLNPKRMLNWVALHLHIAQYVKKITEEGKILNIKERHAASEESIVELFKTIGWNDASEYFLDEYSRYGKIGMPEGESDYAY